MLEDWADVESSTAAKVSGFASARFVVGDDTAADGERGGDIIVELAI